MSYESQLQQDDLKFRLVSERTKKKSITSKMSTSYVPHIRTSEMIDHLKIRHV